MYLYYFLGLIVRICYWPRGFYASRRNHKANDNKKLVCPIATVKQLFSYLNINYICI